MSLIPSSTRESDTDRDGVLSTLTEWHALTIGLVVGVIVAIVAAWELAALFVMSVLGWKLGEMGGWVKELRREPQYALGGFLLPILTRWILLFTGVV